MAKCHNQIVTTILQPCETLRNRVITKTQWWIAVFTVYVCVPKFKTTMHQLATKIQLVWMHLLAELLLGLSQNNDSAVILTYSSHHFLYKRSAYCLSPFIIASTADFSSVQIFRGVNADDATLCYCNCIGVWNRIKSSI